MEPEDSEELVTEFCPEPVQSSPHSHNLVLVCFVDRASLYNLVNKTSLVHNLFSVYLSFDKYTKIVHQVGFTYTIHNLLF